MKKSKAAIKAAAKKELAARTLKKLKFAVAYAKWAIKIEGKGRMMPGHILKREAWNLLMDASHECNSYAFSWEAWSKLLDIAHRMLDRVEGRSHVKGRY